MGEQLLHDGPPVGRAELREAGQPTEAWFAHGSFFLAASPWCQGQPYVEDTPSASGDTRTPFGTGVGTGQARENGL